MDDNPTKRPKPWKISIKKWAPENTLEEHLTLYVQNHLENGMQIPDK